MNTKTAVVVARAQSLIALKADKRNAAKINEEAELHLVPSYMPNKMQDTL